MPGNRPGDVAFFAEKRDQITRALVAAGRDVGAFTFAAQLSCGTSVNSRRQALATSRAFVAAGASHVVLGVPASAAPDGLRAVATEVAEPLRRGRSVAIRLPGPGTVVHRLATSATPDRSKGYHDRTIEEQGRGAPRRR